MEFIRNIVCRAQNVVVIGLMLIVAFGAMSIRAQTVTTTLTIQVRDANGAVVPSATITILNRVTGRTQTATTSDMGSAEFSNLEPGRYEITIEEAGFKKAQIENVVIQPGTARTLDVTLEAGAAAQAVSVTEVEVPEEQISALPNLNNDLTPLLQTVPGSIAAGPAALGRVIIDGKGSDQITNRLDGLDFMVLSDLPSADPVIDVSDSFKKPEVAGNLDTVSPRTRAFPSQLGPGTGGVVDEQTYKGDTAKWQAQFFVEHRNDSFNARNFFDYDGKNALRRTRFGAKGGGPINKTWQLFAAYDGIRGRTERNVYEAIPQDSLCCAVGPLSAMLSGFMPVGTEVVPGSLNPDFVVARRRNRITAASNAWDARVDHVLPTKLSTSGALTFRYIRQSAENVVPDGVTGRRQRQEILFSNALSSVTWPSSDKTTHTIRLGFNRTRANVAVELPPQTSTALAQSLISTGSTVNVTGLPGQPATVPIATLGGLIKNTGRGFTIEPTSYSASYDQLHLFGKAQQINFGVEGRLIRMNLDRLGGLTYNFANLAALRTGTTSTISYLSDLSAASPFSNGTGARQARQWYLLSYLQVTSPIGPQEDDPTDGARRSRLVLTYGLRLDYFSRLTERNHRDVVVDPLTGRILPPDSNFYKTSLILQPRFSLAYRLSSAGFARNTVFRAGAGVYAGVPRTGDLLLPIDSDRISTGINGGTFPTTPTDVAQGFISTPDTRQFQPLAFARNYTAVERLYKWEAQLTQTIRGYDFGLLYTGNVGRNLPLANIANKIVSVQTNPDPTKPAIVVREFDIVRGGQVFQPFSEFFFRTGDGRSRYNAFTVSFGRNLKAEKPPTPSRWFRNAVGGLNIQYTLASNQGNTSGTVLSNPFDVDSDLGFNTGDIRHSFKISGVYDLWKAKAETAEHPANLLMGWKIMPSFRMTSGLPLVIRVNRPNIAYRDGLGNIYSSPAAGRTAVINTPGGGESASARVPDLVPGVNPYLRNDLEFLNPAAFAIPAPGKFGNFRRGTLRGPGFVSLDLGLRRNLFELVRKKNENKFSGQFQVDFFNIFNHANFLNPSAALPGVLGTSVIDNQMQPGVAFTRATAGTFGMLSAADLGRTIQFSLVFRVNDGFTK